MQKVSYMGNGSTTEFNFNFPYFEDSNVVVTKNGTSATGYSIVGTSAGADADIPYTGGKVVFETAPTALDCITIARQLPLARIVDYQPTAKIDPTTLNQDLNYLMEVIKDRQDELDDLRTQYAEIADKESTTTLLARISAIHDEIVAVSAQITALGDISTLRQSVETNTSNITSLGTQKASVNMNDLSTTGKTKIINFGMPDYEAGISVAVSTPMTQRGLCRGYVAGTDANAEIRVTRGTETISVVMAHGANTNGTCSMFPVDIGDVISVVNQTNYSLTLYPYKEN